MVKPSPKILAGEEKVPATWILSEHWAIFYMEGRFPSQDIYLWFSESQDVANETFLSSRRYSDLVADLYNKNIEVSDWTQMKDQTVWNN